MSAISENAGLERAVIVNRVKEMEPGTGFDAVGEKYVDMMQAGIIDPVKVTKSALENAVSISATLLTTEAAVAGYQGKGSAGGTCAGYGLLKRFGGRQTCDKALVPKGRNLALQWR